MDYFKHLIITAFVLSVGGTGYGQVVAAPDPADTTAFTRVEVEATYPGGVEAWKAFLLSNATLRKTANAAGKQKGIQRKTYTVVVQFIVDSDGSIFAARALTKHGFGLEEGAVKVINESGKWIPAFQNGRPVKAYRNQSISFVYQ